ncbi:hypothetical protein Tco_0691104 [Tanacetum coccineum]
MRMGRDQMFTVNLYHDGIFSQSPLKYIQDDEKHIIDINFEEEFLRLGYEQKWYIDLYVEHFDYDVLDFVNEEANGTYFETECNSGLFRGFVDRSVPQTEGDALEDPDDANIDPSCMRYEHPEQLKLALANYRVAHGYQLWPAKSAKTDESTSKFTKSVKTDANTSKTPKSAMKGKLKAYKKLPKKG